MHNTDKMKKIDLQEIVRKAIQEVLNEDAAADKAAQDAAKKAEQTQLAALNKKKSELASNPPAPSEKPARDAEITAISKKIQSTQSRLAKLNKPGMSPLDLDEMANVSVRYELAPDAAAADFAGKKARIITAMQATEEPMSKVEVAAALGYPKQNPINADFMALVADGVIIPSGTQSAPRLNRPAATEPEAGEEVGNEEGPEGGVAGDMSDEEIEASFTKMMGGGEDEPEAGELEKADISGDRISDEDYESFMQYTDLENRLAKVKSDILKTKRSRPSIGDIADQPSNELQNLRDLKNRLQQRMDDLLVGSKYLQARKAKLDKKSQPEETDNEEPLDEWMKGRMQYYAGIKK
jgi:hypothetical protein